MVSGAASYDALLRDAAVALTAAGIDNARFEARLLLAHAAGVTIERLVAHGGDQRLAGPFDLLVSNPPYIESAAIAGLMPDVARFEPHLALDGGPDGLAAYRAIAGAAAALVVSGGRVLIEAGEGQATEIAALLSAAGFAPAAPWKDLGGIDRIVPATH
ncbi:MAG: hypothetical protein EBY18_20230 [Alphaproteobacteria bacterium]|nr:hypothetical protein [Alphaproteobacteria bacterium]